MNSISNLIKIIFGNFGITISVTNGRFDYISISCDFYSTKGGVAYKRTLEWLLTNMSCVV